MFRKLAIGLAIASIAVLVSMGAGESVRAGGGCHEVMEGKLTDAPATAVTIDECAFSPSVVRVQPGDAVQWTNKDNITHGVTGVAASWGDLRQFEQGDAVTYKFAAPGVFPYFCELHPGMVGAVVVGDGASASAPGTGAVNAVSAVAPGDAGDQSAGPSQAEDDGDGLGTAWVALIAILAVLLGAAGAVTLSSVRRRAQRSGS